MNIGRNLINGAIGEFERIRDNLKKGVELCNQEINKQRENISESQRVIADLESHVARAETMSENINNIIGS